jgi:hypothetical protein
LGALLRICSRSSKEVKRERPLGFTSTPDPAPLLRTLLRLRHDFVIFGRARAESFPTRLTEELSSILDRLGRAVSDYLRASARALARRLAPPPVRPLRETLDDCVSEIAALRERELANLSSGQLENLFALGFALDQLQPNICDLERCIHEWVRQPRRSIAVQSH